MKKKRLLLFILLTPIVGFLAFATVASIKTNIEYNDAMKRKAEQYKETDHYKNCQVIKDFKTNIMVYGKEERKFQYLEPTFINSFDEFNIDSKFNVLIISDIVEETHMEDADYIRLKEIVKSGECKLQVIYYGSEEHSKFDKFVELGLTTCNMNKDYHGFIYGVNQYYECLFYDDQDVEREKKYEDVFETDLSYLICSAIKDNLI